MHKLPQNGKGTSQGPRAKVFFCKINSRLYQPIPWVTTDFATQPWSRETGFGQLASSNPGTHLDSELEQHCPSCGCFLERTDLALSTEDEEENQEIIIICIWELLVFFLHYIYIYTYIYLHTHTHTYIYLKYEPNFFLRAHLVFSNI